MNNILKLLLSFVTSMIGVFKAIIIMGFFIIGFICYWKYKIFVGTIFLLIGTAITVYVFAFTKPKNKSEWNSENFTDYLSVSEIDDILEKFDTEYCAKKLKYSFQVVACILGIIITLGGAFVIPFLLGNADLFLVLCFVAIPIEFLLISSIFKVVKEFENLFWKNKTEIISDALKKINPTLEYNTECPEELRETYKNLKFEDVCWVKGKEYITGIVKDFKIEVSNMVVYGSNNSLLDDILFVNVQSPNMILGEVQITQRYTKDLEESFDTDRNDDLINGLHRIKLDNQVFEENFYVETTNDILALQVLTHDIMDLILNFFEKYEIPFELKIKDNNLFWKFHTTFCFKPSLFNSSLERDGFIIDFNLIKSIFNIIETINIK